MDQSSDAFEQRLARLALARGRITSHHLQEAREQQRASGGDLGSILIKSGCLTPVTYRQLALELDGARAEPALEAPPATIPPPITATEVFPSGAETPREAFQSAESASTSPEQEPASREALPGLPPLPPMDPGAVASPSMDALPHAEEQSDGEAWADAAHFLQPIAADEDAPPEDDWADVGDFLSPSSAIEVTSTRSPLGSRQQLRMQIDLLLSVAEREGASDLHLHADQPVMMRVNGKLLVADAAPIAREELRAALTALLDADALASFERTRDLDFAYVTSSGLRTRANICQQQGGVDGVFRLIPRTVRTLTELGLPEDLARFTHYHAGLVLVTGPAGCGKTTTLNALVDIVNQTRDDHILTVEDPVEFVHTSKRCLINQRQVKRHTESFARALRAALREDPDVIVIGELRDLETISLAVTAAETGHLVLGSLHTNGATRTISRILDVFPPQQQGQIRAMVSESLRGVISQKLVPTVDGPRAAALEVLVVTPAISNLIRDDKMHQLRSAMQVGRPLGMRLLDDSIRELVASGRVAAEVAKRYLDAPPPSSAPSSSSGMPTVPMGIPAVQVPPGSQTIPPSHSRSLPGLGRSSSNAPGQGYQRPTITKS